jgi:hypothetical protein
LLTRLSANSTRLERMGLARGKRRETVRGKVNAGNVGT